MDFKMSVDYLPIGSIVRLTEGQKVMINGYFVTDDEDINDIYDYCGCAYPEGYDDLEEMYLFDEDKIEDVIFIGYEDDEGKKFRTQLATDIDEAYEGIEIDDLGSFNSLSTVSGIEESKNTSVNVTEEIERL